MKKKSTNTDFNPLEFDGIKKQAGLNSLNTDTIHKMQTLTARTAKQLEGGA